MIAKTRRQVNTCLWVVARASRGPALLGFMVFSACSDGGTTGPGAENPPPPIVSVAVVPPRDTMIELGATKRFSATAEDASGRPITGVTFTWSSSNVSVATVDASGLAAAVGEGQAEIFAAVSGVTGSAAITVIDAAANMFDGMAVAVTEHDHVLAVAVHERGDWLGVVGEHDSTGEIMNVRGAVIQTESANLTFWFDSAGRPERAVVNEHILYFGNYIESTVDIIVITPSGAATLLQGLQLAALADQAPGSVTVASSSSIAVRDPYWAILKVASIGAGSITCSAGIVAALSSAGVALPAVVPCLGLIVSLASISEQDDELLSASSFALTVLVDDLRCVASDVAACVAFVADALAEAYDLAVSAINEISAATLEVSVSTTGNYADGDGYVLTLDPGFSGQSKWVGGNGGTVRWQNLAPGPHLVELSDVAEQCTAISENPASVTLERGGTVLLLLVVECRWPGTEFEAIAGTYTGPVDETADGLGLVAVFTFNITQADGILGGDYSISGTIGALSVTGAGTLFGTVGVGANPEVNITSTSETCPNFSNQLRGMFDSEQRVMTLTGTVHIFWVNTCSLIAEYPNTVITFTREDDGRLTSSSPIVGIRNQAVVRAGG